MRSKRHMFMAMLCAFSMLGNSAAVVAQSNDKKREAQSNIRQESGGAVSVFQIAEPAPAHTFNVAVAAPPQEIAYAAPQVEFISHEFSFGGKVVKNTPYSAEAVTETIQILYDGNRIVRNFSAKIYRDSAGRTRREQAMVTVGPWAVSGEAPVMISINDPVSGFHYSLNSNTKTAHKMATPRLRNLTDIKGDIKVEAELELRDTRLRAKLKDGVKAADGADARVISGVVTGAASGVAINSFGVAPGSPVVGGDRIFTWSSDAEVNRESLGTQVIEGVVAEGTRTTFTIPAGKIGNDRPIVTVNEQWYSPELQTVVLSKNSDPRMGETTYRLINIAREEPDPSLFQVPPDYTVNESHRFNFTHGSPDGLKKLEIERRTRRPDGN